ncbi:MAG: GlxA family transcriptional regulator [Pseudoruegeria sp.]
MQKWTKPALGCEEITFLLFDRFSHHCLANTLEPLRAVNTLLNREAYRWEFRTMSGAPAQSSSGLPVLPKGPLSDMQNRDMLAVISSYQVHDHAAPAILQDLRKAAQKAHRVAGLDTGPWLMAEAGLLTGYTATLHWDDLMAFEERFLEVNVVRQTMVFDGPRLTCAGALASFDFILQLIEERHGAALALDVEGFFMHESRAVATRTIMKSRDPLVQRAIALMRETVETPRTLAALSKQLGCHPKHLSRRFQTVLGTSPGQAYRHLRLSAAQRLIENTNLSIADIALRCGYDDPGAMSRAYRLRFRETPSQTREAMRRLSVPSPD